MQLYAAFIINLKNKNMNAREKASELIVTYQLQCKSLDYQQAKQCALIAVEEILKCEVTEPSDTDWDDCGSTAQYYWSQKKEDAGKFWGDVKSELQSF
jgi:hypothetical protein